MMNNEFKLNFNFKRKDWFRCVFYSDFIFNGRLIRYLIPFLLLVFIAGFQLIRYKNSGNATILLGVSAVYVGILAISFFITANKQFKEYHKDEETWLLDDNGVSGKMFGEELNVAWEEIFKCEITKKFVYLYINPFIPVYLPRGAFSDEAFDFMINKISEE